MDPSHDDRGGLVHPRVVQHVVRVQQHPQHGGAPDQLDQPVRVHVGMRLAAVDGLAQAHAQACRFGDAAGFAGGDA